MIFPLSMKQPSLTQSQHAPIWKGVICMQMQSTHLLPYFSLVHWKRLLERCLSIGVAIVRSTKISGNK